MNYNFNILIVPAGKGTVSYNRTNPSAYLLNVFIFTELLNPDLDFEYGSGFGKEYIFPKKRHLKTFEKSNLLNFFHDMRQKSFSLTGF